jgi:hypothetical protein
MSGGTLLALAADEIVMDPQAVLGPVDPQLGDMPRLVDPAVVAAKDTGHIDDRFLVLADVAEKAQRQVRGFVTDLLDDRMSPEEAGKLADLLAGGYFTHDFPITVSRARDLGVAGCRTTCRPSPRADGAVPQPSRGRPTVTYLPLPGAAARRAARPHRHVGRDRRRS